MSEGAFKLWWACTSTAIAGAAALLAAAPLSAHELPGEPGAHALEAEYLGEAHADEHAVMRRLQRRQERHWSEMSEAEQRAAVTKERQRSLSFARSTAGNPRKVGKWTTGPSEIPNFAIHVSLLPTGKVLFWGYPPHAAPNVGQAAIWDPKMGTGPAAYHEIDPPYIDPDGDGPQGYGPAPLYCSGQSLLPDGRLLVTGGNARWPNGGEYASYSGMDETFVFYPWGETWVQGPDMEGGRWYPSQAVLGDGRTVLLGGYDNIEPGGIRNDRLETYSASGDVITHESSADRSVEPYPNLFSLPDGDLLLAGAEEADSAVLDTQAMTWANLEPNSFHRVGGTAVLQPSSRSGSWTATQIGGYRPPYENFRPAAASAESIDARESEPTWRPSPALHIGRSYHSTVLLPDGSMATLGGAAGFSQANGNYETNGEIVRRRVELLGANGSKWRLGPAQMEDRTYHSVAILLPDGRIWSAGDDVHGPQVVDGESEIDTAEIYSPPYLFQGRRPKIKEAPTTLNLGQRFSIRTSKGVRVKSASLVAPAAATHSNDNQQRLIALDAKRGSTKRNVVLQAPAKAGALPPGFYMLFAMSKNGTPSVAKWVQILPEAG